MNNTMKEIVSRWEKLKKRVQEDDFCQEMDALKYFMYFNAERSSVFFSPFVLLVEGPSEVVLINRLRDIGELALPETYYVMDCIGKFNIHRMMNLFSKLGITHSVIFDSDNYEREHSDLNQLIYESRNNCTVNIGEIPGNLEVYLGLPQCNYPDKKPQVILYALEKGRIEDEKKSTFCELVTGVLDC